MGSYAVGLDLGLSSGAVAVVWPIGQAYAADVRGWDGPESAADARAWVGLVAATLPVPLAVEWACEAGTVTRRAPRAGEAQLRSAREWDRRAAELGARLVDVAVRTWRADYGIAQRNPAACRESRALVRLLWPSLVLGPRDHVADACLLALRAVPGGVAWARQRQALAGHRGADVPEWVAAHLARMGR